LTDNNSLAAYHAYERLVSRRSFRAAVGLSLGLYLLGYSEVGKGLVLGAVFSVLNFALMAQCLPLQVGLGAHRRKATFVALASVLLRFVLMAVPLGIGLRSDRFSFWAVVVGLFSIPLGIVAERVVFRKRLDSQRVTSS